MQPSTTDPRSTQAHGTTGDAQATGTGRIQTPSIGRIVIYNRPLDHQHPGTAAQRALGYLPCTALIRGEPEEDGVLLNLVVFGPTVDERVACRRQGNFSGGWNWPPIVAIPAEPPL